MSKTYSAGIVTAYGAAKRAGYQGTYEDFCRQQAEYAENASAVEQAKTAAVNAANTATAKAGEATTAATDAQTAKIQTEQAASQALTDISTARSGAISAVQTEGQTQTANARTQAQAAEASATTASTKASEASASATSAGQSATNAAASATSAGQSARDAQDVLDSIPVDYSDLSANVSQLRADLVDLQEGGYVADAQQIQTKINAWLSNHPEATTTVQNGSLTEAKFTNALKLKTIKEYVTPQMFGAVGDGITDDTQAVQNAINTGKVVYIPKGIYKTTNAIVVPSNATIFGDGESSVISNTVLSGFEKNVFIIGSLGSGTASGSPNNLTKYEASVLTDRYSLETDSSANFNVGDLVLISNGAINRNPENVYVDKIKSIEDGTIVFEDYISNMNLSNSVYIQNLNDIDAVDELGNPRYIAENVNIHNLALRQELDDGSGMYVLSLACYKSEFRDIYLKGNTLVGSNLTVKTIFDNVGGRFDAGLVDAPEYFIESIYRNCIARRYGSRLNNIGLSIQHGFRGIVENCNIDFCGNGKIGLLYNKGAVVQNNSFFNLNKAPCVECCIYGGTILRNNILDAPTATNFIYLNGTGNIIKGNYINCPLPRWYPATIITLRDNVIEDNHNTGYSTSDALVGYMVDTRISTKFVYTNVNTRSVAVNDSISVLPTESYLLSQGKLIRIIVNITSNNGIILDVNGTNRVVITSNFVELIWVSDQLLVAHGADTKPRINVANNGSATIVLKNTSKTTAFNVNFLTVETI